MSEPILKEAREKFIKSMNALFIAVDEEEAIDIRLSVFAYTNQLEQQSQRIEELEGALRTAKSTINRIQEPEFSGHGCDGAIEEIDRVLDKE